VYEFVVEHPASLQLFIQERLGFSSSKAKRFLQQGGCRLNGHIERFGSTKLIRGDRLLCQEKNSCPVAKEAPLAPLYEDSEVILFDKPPYISSEAFAASLKPCLLAHRLDKDTTGVLLFAKTSHVLEKLKIQFQHHEVKKHYLALVDGKSKPSFSVENHLFATAYLGGKKMVEDKKGLYAKTLFQKEAFLNACTLLSCYPITGRTHQIRAHLQSVHHPIVGDLLYNEASSHACSRHLLHAYSLSFISENRRREVFSPLPHDFQQQIKLLDENFNYKNIRTR
jgi:23S rRNA pseudouridine955/2504/2580 synthase/23S rRNA pseudouridine1911/1915/1917 synthase